MAVISPAITPANPADPTSGYVVVWATVTNADTCAATPSNISTYVDRSVQFSGVFGSATAVLNGSNGSALTYVALTDPQGNAISKTLTNTLEQVEEATVYCKPTFSGGDGTQSITVTMYFTGYRAR